MVSGEGRGLLYLTLHCHYRIIGFVVTSSQPQRLYQGDVGHTASGVAFQVDSSRLPGYATEGTLWASLSGVILQTLPELVTLLKAHSGHRFPVSSSRLCLNWLRYWRHSLSIAFRYHPPDCLNWLRYWRHTLGIAFRCHPPDSAWTGYATEGTLWALLSGIILQTAWIGYATEGTLWASLSGVILQTLPELVTLLKAHSEHCFPVSSSRLPELVTLLKAHSEHCFPVSSSRLPELVTLLKAHSEHCFPASSSRLPELVTLLKAHSEHCFPVSSSRLPELVTLLKAHSEHCFPASSSRLCLKSKIGYATEGTLFNSCCCLLTGSALRKFGYL